MRALVAQVAAAQVQLAHLGQHGTGGQPGDGAEGAEADAPHGEAEPPLAVLLKRLEAAEDDVLGEAAQELPAHPRHPGPVPQPGAGHLTHQQPGARAQAGVARVAGVQPGLPALNADQFAASGLAVPLVPVGAGQARLVVIGPGQDGLVQLGRELGGHRGSPREP
jgi:hypothetical protein